MVFDRLLRIATSLLVVVGTYLLYWLLVVPWVEPAGANEGAPVETVMADPGSQSRGRVDIAGLW